VDKVLSICYDIDRQGNTKQKEMPMYKVFAVEGGYEIFWCPSAPTHFADKIAYDGKVYTTRPAAYRRVKQLNDAAKKETKAI
jgi:hypothetical protein